MNDTPESDSFTYAFRVWGSTMMVATGLVVLYHSLENPTNLVFLLGSIAAGLLISFAFSLPLFIAVLLMTHWLRKTNWNMLVRKAILSFGLGACYFLSLYLVGFRDLLRPHGLQGILHVYLITAFCFTWIFRFSENDTAA